MTEGMPNRFYGTCIYVYFRFVIAIFLLLKVTETRLCIVGIITLLTEKKCSVS
jgi:hypothetical protein